MKHGFTSKTLEYFDFLANHFEHSDWNYTRLHNIKEIKYSSPVDTRDNFKHRLKLATRFARNKNSNIYGDLSVINRVRMFFYCLKREKQVPDGSLDRGNVITYWEETGEYLQMVQPSVGALVANFLKEDPENKHAKLILAEMERISKAFSKRIKEGDVSG